LFRQQAAPSPHELLIGLRVGCGIARRHAAGPILDMYVGI
jgi:hypothetical protein